MDELMERMRLIAALLIRIDIKINKHRWTMKNNKKVKKKKHTAQYLVQQLQYFFLSMKKVFFFSFFEHYSKVKRNN